MTNAKNRRKFFKYMSVLGLAAMFEVPAYAKATKEALQYQDTPKNGQACKTCMHFLPETNECKIVQGEISPEGWCVSYYKLPDNQKEKS